MKGFWRNMKVKVRHNRGDEDKFNSFVEKYDEAMEMIKKELSQDEQDELKKELNEIIED